MNRFMARCLQSATTCIVLASAGTVHAKVLNVPLTIAEHDNWTWVASAQALLKFYGKTGITQTQIINTVNNGVPDRTGSVDPEKSSIDDRCNSQYFLGRAVKYYGAPAGSYYDWMFGGESPLTTCDYAKQINSGHPFAIRWRFGSVTDPASYERHVIFRGFNGTTLKDTTTCYIMDPFPGHGYVCGKYSWVKRCGTRVWDGSFLTSAYPYTGYSFFKKGEQDHGVSGTPFYDSLQFSYFAYDDKGGVCVNADKWFLNGPGTISPFGVYKVGSTVGIGIVSPVVDGLPLDGMKVRSHVHFEAEKQTTTSSAIGTTIVSDPQALGAKYVQFNAGAKIGDWMEISMPPVPTGYYDIIVYSKSDNNNGIFELSVNGWLTFVNQHIDNYSPSAKYRNIGTFKIYAGGSDNVNVRLTMIGKNPASTGYQLAIDQIIIHPSNCAADSECAPPFFQLEAEDLWRQSSGYGTKVVNSSLYGSYVDFAFTNSTIGDYMEFTLNDIPPDAYDIVVGYKANSNRGMFQATIDGVKQGSVVDEYNPTPEYAYAAGIGTIIFKETPNWSHTIRFTTVGKNPASAGYTMAIDYIQLYPVPMAKRKKQTSGPETAKPVISSVAPNQPIAVRIFSLNGKEIYANTITMTPSAQEIQTVLSNNKIASGSYMYTMTNANDGHLVKSGKLVLQGNAKHPITVK